MNTKELRAAIISYPVGTKFSHPNFGNDEYIVADENNVAHTEDGYECSSEFWEIRKDWTGWYVKEEVSTAIPVQEVYPYYLNNYVNIPDNYNPQYCYQCKLLKEDHTCPYSRKPIKLIHSTGCKFHKKK